MRQGVLRTPAIIMVSCFLVLGLAFWGAKTSPAQAYQDSEEAGLILGDVFTQPVKELQRVSITDPEIADITDATLEQVSVIGKKVGQTTLFIWDSQGKQTINIRVFEQDLPTIKMRLRTLLESSGIPQIGNVFLQENEQEGKVVLSGSLPESQLTTLNSVVAPFAKDIINLVQKGVNEDLVQIDAQVTELNTTLAKEIGVNWSNDQDGTTSVLIQEREVQNQDFFKIGSFMRTSAILAKVNALIQEGKARILSKPRLVVVNGTEARLLVGGEVPIKTASTINDSGVSTSYEYKEYGVTLTITPTIRNGKVDILMNVEIRDLDKANSMEGNVAFLTRTAQTRLLLDDRQTIVLAGMIRKSVSENTSRVAGLSKIPVLGFLFQNKQVSPASEDREVVIVLTPTVIPANAAPLAQMTIAPGMAGSAVPAGLLFEGGRNNKSLPVITKNAATVSTRVPEGIEDYASAVQNKISEAIAYPLEAREQGWQGTVKLGLVIRRDGSLRDAFVQESSGYEVFDQDAVNTAHLVAPFPPFSENLLQDRISVNLPIVYSTDKFLKDVAARQ